MSTTESRAAVAVADHRQRALLSVEGLTVEFATDRGPIRVVEDVSFELAAGTTVGVVGESGSGKSVTARAILGLTGSNGRIAAGHVHLDGTDLTTLSQRDLRDVRGNDVSMIFQEPRRSLDPAFAVGDLIAEVARRHLGLSRKAAWDRAVEVLDRVHIANAAERAKDYPHQFSGGMCQRVMLAMALAGDPRVLIADEPTTALDVTVQAHILELMRELQRDLDLAVLFITHDLGVVAEMCDRVVVMYAGQVVEAGPSRTIFRNPQMPYTQALLDSLPQVAQDRLTQIPGVMPTPGRWPAGCRFHTRCAHATDACTELAVPLEPADDNHAVRCLRRSEVELRGIG